MRSGAAGWQARFWSRILIVQPAREPIGERPDERASLVAEHFPWYSPMEASRCLPLYHILIQTECVAPIDAKIEEHVARSRTCRGTDLARTAVTHFREGLAVDASGGMLGSPAHVAH